jgi:hypothetical protein
LHSTAKALDRFHHVLAVRAVAGCFDRAITSPSAVHIASQAANRRPASFVDQSNSAIALPNCRRSFAYDRMTSAATPDMLRAPS